MPPVVGILANPKDNGPEVAKLLLDRLNVKISWTTLKREIERHPDCRSLVSISDVFNRYGVENLAASFENEKLINIPQPFITQIKGKINDNYFFSVVKEVKEDTIHFFDPQKHKWSFTSKETFLQRWSGLVLLTEVKGDAGETEYDKRFNEENRERLTIFCIPVIILFAGVIAFVYDGTNALFPFIFSVLTLSGGIIGVLLLWYELDRDNPMLHQICSMGRKTNCDSVLQAKGARISGLSWSLIGATYFMGELLLLLFNNENLLKEALNDGYLTESKDYLQFAAKYR